MFLCLTLSKVTLLCLSYPPWHGSHHSKNCPTLQRVYSYLSQGTRLNHKDNKATAVKHYLQVCTIGQNGLLVVRREMPFSSARDLLVVPPHGLSGLITALHLRLQHPSKLQLNKLFHRYFYAREANNEINRVTAMCSQWAAMKSFPQEIDEFTTSNDKQSLGTHFACDVMHLASQCIFLLRDSFSSYTITTLIPDEQKSTIKATLTGTTA